jgi:uncharacterized protein YhfF
MNRSPLPAAEFGFPGPLRDRLVAAILAGQKTTTTSLLVDYTVEDEPLPSVGSRQAVVDSSGTPVAVIETVAVQQIPLHQVPLAHAVDEGEGHHSIKQWRADHERFWHSDEQRAYLQDPTFTVHDDTMVILERFRLVAM